ncbi:3-oxoacyl-ACP reductase FabG [Geomonas sp. RF6]|uniref:3-oxoacyl-ACP reductase family protein n=1 Tax=Geomonas sp. RF6 TaxID=2897342 RepID=UPI001E4767AF|nr:3-oxoacyl-ACP reductase family protein [Geomonas sp. RF6]UFS69541.1 3-oxoacyl-ACP reductase FabG [Geomonas sp. RF6]
MNGRLEKKRALVTGGSRGIGAAIVRRLASEGADVAFTYISRGDQAKEVTQAARAFGVNSFALRADSADAEAVIAAVERTVREFGGMDILVNNAGIAVIAPVEELRLEDFDRSFAVNVRATFVAIQAAVKHMQSGGRIINIASCNAERVPFTGGAAYAMSKSALVGLVKGLARDLALRGITVNNVHPGPIETEMNSAGTEFGKMLLEHVLALPRYGTAEEVAGVVAFLASPEAAYITGAGISIDGGFTA